MSTILYARSVLSPKSMLVWLMMMELPRSGVALPEDESLLARLCMTTPRGLAKARSEITAAGLDDIDPFAESFTVSESRQQNFKPNSQSSAERMRRFRERKASQSDGDVTVCDEDVASHVTMCDDTKASPVTDSDATSDDDVTQKGGSSLSLEVSPAPLPKPNPILPKEGIYPAHEKLEITPAMLAAPIPLEPDIIPPDLSDIRGAVAGMLAGVVVPMSETPAEPATTPPAIAETTGQSAILPPAIRESRITQPMEAEHGENPSRSATPIPPCRTGTGSVKPRRSPGISQHLQFEFDQFWDACPRKVGKTAALKAYVAARNLASWETLLEAMKSYARSRAGEDPQYTCHPATWLNQGRWDDEILPDAGSSPTSGPSPRGGDAGGSVMRPGRRVSSDPVEAAFAEQMAEIKARERESQHVH